MNEFLLFCLLVPLVQLSYRNDSNKFSVHLNGLQFVDLAHLKFSEPRNVKIGTKLLMIMLCDRLHAGF
jgi:hypothetical protein